MLKAWGQPETGQQAKIERAAPPQPKAAAAPATSSGASGTNRQAAGAKSPATTFEAETKKSVPVPNSAAANPESTTRVEESKVDVSGGNSVEVTGAKGSACCTLF